jgi:hypothetical protein
MSLIKLKETPEQIELIKAMGSKNLAVSREAAEAVAAFLGPVIRKVLLTLGTSSAIYRDAEFDEDADPSLPLDLFYDASEGYVTTWSQSQAGGLPTSTVNGIAELKFQTYRLDSAVSFNKRYARKHRLDVVSKAIERMVNEVLIKQERNAWSVILKALAEAKTPVPTGGGPAGGAYPTTYYHTTASATAGTFLLNDLNKLMTRIKRINESYSANTPIQPYSNGPTDLYVSPEIKEQIRAFAYNPIRTDASSTNANNQFLSDDLRNEIWRSAGMQSIFGIVINELVELGGGQKYNVLFDTFVQQSPIAANIAGHNSGAWQANNNALNTGDQIAIAIDNSRGAFIRPVARQAESGGTFSVLPDGQWDGYGARVEKVGFYGFVEEGRLCIDARAIAGISI